MLYSRFQTSQTGGQQYSDTPFSIPCPTLSIKEFLLFFHSSLFPMRKLTFSHFLSPSAIGGILTLNLRIMSQVRPELTRVKHLLGSPLYGRLLASLANIRHLFFFFLSRCYLSLLQVAAGFEPLNFELGVDCSTTVLAPLDKKEQTSDFSFNRLTLPGTVFTALRFLRFLRMDLIS